MRTLLLLLLVAALSGCQSQSPAPAAAQEMENPVTQAKTTPAPTVSALDQDGDNISFSELYKQGTVLVYFYPAADTPGCTAQSCSLRDAYEQLTELGVTVVGVSLDNQADQAAFKQKYNLPFTLIADTEKKVVDAFGVSYRGKYASREAFLIQSGEIVWHDDSASTAEQANDVLKLLQ